MILVLARLTLREALSRRVLLALVLLSLLVVAATAWGFAKISEVTATAGVARAQANVLVSQLLVMVMFMFSFVVGMTAVFVASPSIAGDIESGIALAVLARPIRRGEVLFGKWLGNAVVLVTYAIGGGALELAVVQATTGYAPPEPLAFLLYLAGETVVGVTLATLLSTFVTPMAGGAIAVVCFGLAWIAGVASAIGELLVNPTLVHVGTATRLILPTDGLWRGAMYALEPASIVLAAAGARSAVASNPFLALSPPPATYLAWCIAWIVTVLGASLWVFRRREL